jgi:hypothetical protein
MVEFHPLNMKHSNEPVFVVGSGPQLADLTEHQIKQLRTRPSIGLNYTPFAVPTSYGLTSYPIVAVILKQHFPAMETILMRLGKRRPKFEGVTLLKKMWFDGALEQTLFAKDPVIRTMRNVGLAATHLAMLMGASSIVYIGVEQNNHIHFFHCMPKARRRMANAVANIRSARDARFIQRIDHWIDKLLKEVNTPATSASLVKFSQGKEPPKDPLFKAYFDIAKTRGINIYSTTKDSIVVRGGGEYRPLDEFL